MINEYDYEGKLPWYQEHIKKMLPYVTRLLRRENIVFWLDWGTLLGAVRNGKMIPWDFDIDIGIFHKDVKRLLDTESQIVKNGFRFLVDRNAKYARKIRFFTEDIRNYRSYFPEYPKGFEFHIDIDPWVIEGDVAKATFDISKIHTMKELLNLKEIEFEGAMYPCPDNPEESLNRLIGCDWKIQIVLSGNMIYIQRYDSKNTDILEKVKKHAICD